jgi:hypothetical protein
MIALKVISYKPINLSHIQTPGTACPEAKKMLTTCKMGCDVLRIFPEAGEVHSVPM